MADADWGGIVGRGEGFGQGDGELAGGGDGQDTTGGVCTTGLDSACSQ